MRRPGSPYAFDRPLVTIDPIVAAPHRRRLAAVALGAAVDFVGQHPAAVASGDRGDAIEVVCLEPRAGRIVRIADDDQLRARRHQRVERVDVDPPSRRRAATSGHSFTVAPNARARPHVCM